MEHDDLQQLETDDDDLSWLPQDFSVMVGQRGRPKLVHGGFSFTRNKIVQGKAYWSCAQVKQRCCRARLVLWRKVQGVKFTQPVHTHDPEFETSGQ